MQVELFSDKYKVCRLTSKNIEEVYDLLSKNVLYYEYCPPFVTRQAIQEDMKILPPGKVIEDKYYIGFYQDGRLIAVMDLIDGYPEKQIVYIGFFMTDISVQGRGKGSEIIDYLCGYLSRLGYESVRLAWVKGNPQSEHFWLKNGFAPLMETTSNAADEVILAERMLLMKSSWRKDYCVSIAINCGGV